MDDSSVSYWLESCGDDLTPRPPLDGSVDVDVAVLGAGLHRTLDRVLAARSATVVADPDRRARDRRVRRVGSNGAWCTSGFGAGPDLLTHHYGRDAARAVHDAMVATVDEVGQRLRGRGDRRALPEGRRALAGHRAVINSGARRAASAASTASACPSSRHRLDQQAAAENASTSPDSSARSGSPRPQPCIPVGWFAGLARAVERKGATIVEQTAVTNVRHRRATPRSRPTAARCDAGVVVLAGESYLSGLPGYRRVRCCRSTR